MTRIAHKSPCSTSFEQDDLLDVFLDELHLFFCFGSASIGGFGHFGFKVCYSSVSKYILTTLGHTEETEECFIRQRYRPGQGYEFDWGEMAQLLEMQRHLFRGREVTIEGLSMEDM